MNTSLLKNRSVSGLQWCALAQVAKQLVSVLVFMVLSRLIGPGEFGLLSMTMVIVGFGAMFGDAGFSVALVNRTDLRQEHITSVFWMQVALGAILFSLAFVVAPVIVVFYKEPRVLLILISLAPVFLLNALRGVPGALLNRQMAFRSIAIADVTATVVSGVIAMVAAHLSFGVWSLVLQVVALSATSTVLYWRYAAWRPEPAFSWRACRELMGFSLNLFSFNLINYCARNADTCLIGRFIGSAPLGIYSRSATLVMLPLTQVAGITSNVMIPALSSIQGDVQRVKDIYLRVTRLLSLVSFPLMLGFLVSAEPFIICLCGPQWGQAIPIFRILCLVGMAQSMMTTMGWLFIALGRSDVLFTWSVYSAIVSLFSFAVGLHWGIQGVAIAYACCSIGPMWTPLWILAGRLLRLPYACAMRNLLGTFLCSVSMAGIMAVVQAYLPSVWSAWVRLALLAATGVLSYGLMIHAIRLRAYLEARELLAHGLVGKLLNWLRPLNSLRGDT